MPQLSYNYQTPRGIAGSLMDIAPYVINSRINGETADGVLKFGMGAMVGNNPGSDVLVPTPGMEVTSFEGVVLTGFTQEMNMAGEVQVRAAQTVGVLRYGHCWVRVPDGVTPAYGDALYLVVTGNGAGTFTNNSGAGIKVAGMFIGGLGTGNVAPVEIYSQSSSILADVSSLDSRVAALEQA